MSQQKTKTQLATELMGKGATLLRETCPKCGGLQLRYKGRLLCVNEDDLTEATKIEGVATADIMGSLRELVVMKLQEASSNLASERDLDRQLKLADLIRKYVELLKETKEKNQEKKD
ncbi:MAG: autoantigen p27 domain-containing protein [Thaumarchaeota archaeon]|nr:autoantigen p27 domain-containing protein [Nitrososphaerota archaeon]